ncbi:AAA family ATPase [Sabulicella rubraurantiaca]|uniref:AAA family ATPase n=1 Tax=Sabulicella rubraurantiaca TaxID=2811429 RepID=UPI001A96E525|nr:AAA family ATPase [Sabulicella rubraurantiaca]
MADAIPHASWQRARAAAMEALRQGRVVLILGEAGSGKTLLLRELERSLRDEGRPVRFLEHALLADPDEVGSTLLVDEAGSLDDAALRRLCSASVPVAIAALPSFVGRLESVSCPAALVPLAPLTPEEVRRFVAAALAAVGSDPDRFSAEAVEVLAILSRGLPRLVNSLGRAATFLAEMEGAPHVGAQHVEAADAMRPRATPETEPKPRVGLAPEPMPVRSGPPALVPEPTPREPASPRRNWLVWFGVVAVAALLAGAWLYRGDRPAPVAEAPSVPAPAASASAPATVAEAAPPAREAQAAATPAAQPVPAPVLAVPAGGYRGSHFNATASRGGWLRLFVEPGPGAGEVRVRLESHGGLVGTGELRGRAVEGGGFVAVGEVLLDRVSHRVKLEAAMNGGQLLGDARFTPASSGDPVYSEFKLAPF